MLREDLGVQRMADALGVGQREVFDAAREASRMYLRLQQAQGKRRREQRTKRHRDEHDVVARGHFSAEASRIASASNGTPLSAWAHAVVKSVYAWRAAAVSPAARTALAS